MKCTETQRKDRTPKKTVRVKSIVVGAFGAVYKSLEKGFEELEISGRIETIQTTEYWEESRKPVETWYQSDSSERPPGDAGVKNSLGVK